VVASLLKPGSVFGVVAIGMGSAKLVKKITTRLSNRTLRERSFENSPCSNNDDDDDDDEEEEAAVGTTAVETTTAGVEKGGKMAGTRRTSFLRKEDENEDLLAYLSDLITTNAASTSHNKRKSFQMGVTAKTHLSYMTVKTQIVAAYGSEAFERNKGAVQAMLESRGSRSGGGGDGRGRIGGGETKSTGAEDITEAESGGLELAVILNTEVSLRTSTPEEEFAFEDGTGGAPGDVQIEIGEGKERAEGLSLEGHDSNIITRMQATQRMKQAQRLHEDEHGIHV
jgi:hypothetical protein